MDYSRELYVRELSMNFGFQIPIGLKINILGISLVALFYPVHVLLRAIGDPFNSLSSKIDTHAPGNAIVAINAAAYAHAAKYKAALVNAAFLIRMPNIPTNVGLLPQLPNSALPRAFPCE